MNKLRIAQVTNLQESVPPKGKNGLEQVVSDLTEELVRLGHDVTLFATADSQTGAKLVPLWPTAISRDPDAAWRPDQYGALAISEAFLRQHEFDIIHVHTRFIPANFAGLLDTPVVSTVHHPISKELSYLNSYHDIYRRHSQNINTVVVSRFQQQQLPLPSSVIYNGVPLGSWGAFEVHPANYFAFLGYITKNKGVAQAIQAISKTDQKLIIAGDIRQDDPSSKAFYDEFVAPFIDGQKIKYVGPLGFTEKQDLLRHAKATLMPIQWDEPFGLVAIESMACGTPVIAWNRAAMPEIIDDGQTGFLVSSVEQMAEKIGLVDSLSRQQARQAVENRFSARQMASQYVDLYHSLLKD